MPANNYTPWRIAVVNVGVNAAVPVYIELILKHIQPTEDGEALPSLYKSLSKIDTAVFVGFKDNHQTRVSLPDELLHYIDAGEVIKRIVDRRDAYIEADKTIPELWNVPYEKKVRLVKTYWDDSLTEAECVSLYSTMGYINRQGEASIVPRLLFTSTMKTKLASLLLEGLSFSGPYSHCLFTVSFRRYHVD